MYKLIIGNGIFEFIALILTSKLLNTTFIELKAY
jgi:hypothetical protein